MGATPGRSPEFATAAASLGRVLGERGVRLVYGGGHVGLMGTVADAALAAGGPVTGVITDFLVGKEIGHSGLTELHVVESMHERKALMADLADGFITLPGGFGTLDESVEMITWSQLGLQLKPIVFLDVGNFWDPWFAFIEQMDECGFLRPAYRNLLWRAATAEEAVDLVLGASA